MPMNGQNQAEILKLLGELPPETMKNVEALGKILQQDLKEGKLTQAQIQEELKSGTLEQTLRTLNPEAGPLLDDIGSDEEPSQRREPAGSAEWDGGGWPVEGGGVVPEASLLPVPLGAVAPRHSRVL